MYETFFQLRQRPFLASPSTERYFAGQAIEHARQTMIRCIDRAQGPGLVVGPPGTGKSLLCQLLAEHFRASFRVAVLANTKLCTRRALLQSILFELNLPYRDLEEGELRLSLVDHLEPDGGHSRGLLLIIDEAHTLPLRLLEEVRMIGNLVRNGEPRVQLVLVGGAALEERFASPKLETFNQRLAARCYLQSLSREETRNYIRTQLSVVGGTPERIFTEEAMRAVFSATDGVPRLINQVCDYAMLLASVAGQSPLAAATVEEAWADLQQLPAPWQTSLEKAAPTNVVEFGALEDDVVEPESTPPATAARLSMHGVHERHISSSERTGADHAAAPDTDAQLDAIQRNMDAVCDTEYPNCTLDDFGYVQTIAETNPAPAETLTPENSSSGAATPEVVETPAGVAEATHEFSSTPASKSPPRNPFGEFAEEEVVLDDFESLDQQLLEQRPLVSCLEGREYAAALFAVEKNLVPAVATESVAAESADHELPKSSSVAASTAATSETATKARAERFDPATDPVFPEPADDASLDQTTFTHSFIAVARGEEFRWPPAEQSDRPETLPMRIMPRDDRDLLVLEDENGQVAAAPPPTGKAQRQEYRQLFARLRRG